MQFHEEDSDMNRIYKVIALDMDGTLLKSDKTIHQDSIRDIQAAVENGIYVVYCTGRALSELQSYIKVLLAEYLRIPISQAAGIGDADNDKDMLRKVGFSVAMGNASDAIKNYCNFVTKDNDHNGVGEAIRYIMSNMR